MLSRYNAQITSGLITTSSSAIQHTVSIFTTAKWTSHMHVTGLPSHLTTSMITTRFHSFFCGIFGGQPISAQCSLIGHDPSNAKEGLFCALISWVTPHFRLCIFTRHRKIPHYIVSKNYYLVYTRPYHATTSHHNRWNNIHTRTPGELARF